jgi:hypothetical protein
VFMKRHRSVGFDNDETRNEIMGQNSIRRQLTIFKKRLDSWDARCPILCSLVPREKPGRSASTINILIWLCRFPPSRERAKTRAKSHTGPLLINILLPFRT